MSWVMPFPEKATTDEYGTLSAYRKKNKMQPHSGTDWSPAGSNKGKTLIPAVADGKVKLIQWSNILGWVVVQSATAKDGKVWYIGYCHLKCNKCGINCKGGHDAHLAFKFEVGHALKAGDVSHGMTIGNSGTASSGAHLHATASKAVKGVFGVTADKVDLKKLILKNGDGAVAPKVDKKTAKAIIKGEVKPEAAKAETAPAPATEVKPLVADSSKELTVDDWKKFQELLKRDHGYTGAIDGNPGKNTWSAIQRSVAAYGYTGPIDGAPGANTYKGVQRRLVARADYEGRIDGTWGPQTIAALRGAISSNKY